MRTPVHILGDKLFALLVVALVTIGTATFLSASLGLLARQNANLGHLATTQILLGLIPGLLVLMALRLIQPTVFQKWALPVYVLSLLFTGLVFVPQLGVHANGASRWIDIGPVTVQPAEFLKIAVVLMFALYLSNMKSKLHDFRYGLGGFAVVVGIPCLLLIMQPNTSTVLVLGASTAAMYFVAGAPLRDFFILALITCIGLGLLVWQRPYLAERITTFLHPSHDSLATGYQIQQSLIAIGSGGLLGRGYGQSVQKFNYLPEAVDDAIFAVYAEEFGFIGTVLLLLLYIAFASRGLYIAATTTSLFGTLVVMGLTLIISISALLNIGAMLSVFPLTGLPLPFISHGGSALLAALASVGIILNIAAHKRKKV